MPSCGNGKRRFGHASNNKSEWLTPHNALSLSQVSPISVQSLGSPQAELANCDLAKHPVAMDSGVLPSRPKEMGADDPFFSFSHSRATSQPTASIYATRDRSRLIRGSASRDISQNVRLFLGVIPDRFPHLLIVP